MRKNKFTTARRFTNKAREMDASLKDVASRMITLCDVYCAKLEKSGDEFDWYKILQIEQNADNATIKKKYKKLALCVHPDKNQFPGAESAFKIIGEAESVLLDKFQRRCHDRRRKPVKNVGPAASSSYQPPKAPTTGCVTPGVFAENNNGKRKRKNSDNSCSKSSVECEEVLAGNQDSQRSVPEGPSFNVVVTL
ncbi:Chaperone protein dnaJ 49 [Cardamine amara subsp. amara]|uniref:Chaperone protein dnaJ 49 n=1 Tax=Cardamine amara subsp. amara TaxID=228776 RepID=A0ABD1AQ82_CARAN